MPILAAAILLAPTRAAAQSATERVELERFRDSIGPVLDTMALLTRERVMIEEARANRTDALVHLKLGFLSLHIGDLGGKRHYDDAASEFQWASELKPQWPYSWYGLGLAEQGVGDSQVSIVAGIKSMLGKDALTRSAMAFAKSAEVDPAFDQGLVHLAKTALRQRINIKLDLALQALRAADSTAAGHLPSVLLYRGRVEREAGDPKLALTAFRRYLATENNVSLGQLEVARTKFLLGQLDGLDPYLAGARTDDTTTVAQYRYDFSLIASPEELDAFDGTTRATRPAFLEDFWSSRDRADLRRDGERLGEHYRRLYYARKNFALVSKNRHYDISEVYRSSQEDFDDRGVIYIRHGEPTDRATYTGNGVYDNESWRYVRADGDLIFHFVAREDVQDYKLVESVFDIMGFSEAVALRGTGASGNAVATELLDSRDHLSPLYRRIRGAGTGATSRLQAEERTLGRTSIDYGTTSDSYELRFPEALRAQTQVLAVGTSGRGNRGLIHVAFAIPGSALTGVANVRGTIYPVRLRFVAMDGTGHPVSYIDTTRVFLARVPVPKEEYLVGEVNVPAPPGKLSYRLAVQQGEQSGVILPTDSVLVEKVDGGGLGLSDPVLGLRSANLTWGTAQGDTVFFNPNGRFHQNDLVELYYEVYGLTTGTDYETQLIVRKRGGGGGFLGIGKLFGGGSAEISLRFEEPATTPTARVQRSIQLNKLKSGNYTLELHVTDASGVERKREQDFVVVK